MAIGEGGATGVDLTAVAAAAGRALPARLTAVPVSELLPHWRVVANLLAGSLSLAVSLPTMLVAFARYSRDQSFIVLRQHARFATAMTHGSIAGTIGGGLLLGVVPNSVLVPGLALPLVLCRSVHAMKVGGDVLGCLPSAPVGCPEAWA